MSDILARLTYKSIFHLLSALALCLISVYMMASKKMSVHPYPLVAFTCAAESIYFFNKFLHEMNVTEWSIYGVEILGAHKEWKINYINSLDGVM